ncbi:uncharacterized protein V1513DRAFT_56224 [Lipomyces chichibuensis]|uniref:uncharacterized protein n=1 Tax=Lipomyces chichibuensis TaxID=1546026 RepID=UPI00334307F1
MSSLFQAITRPADDFLEVRSSILNGISGNKAPRGPHKITLVDHTVSHHSDAINTGENTGSYGSVDSDELAPAQIERLQQQQQPNTVVETRQEGETSEYPDAIKQTDSMPPAFRGPGENTPSTALEESTIGFLGQTASNESAPLLPDRAGSPGSSIVFGRSRKKYRKCMDFQLMLKRVFSAICCCMPSLVDGMDDEVEAYNTWNEADGPLDSIVPARIRHGYSQGYTRLKEDNKEMKPVGGNIFRSDPNVKYDILYENQRGFFAFGHPLFSSKGLLNYDPSPWVDADYKHSPVDILSAPVPDPSWEWVWRTWYIDMTYDVDDQGWSYSLSFTSDKWHGAHVWFHSFVRRRRWIRKRRKNVTEISADSEAPKGTFGTVNQSGTNTRPEVYSVLEGNAPEYFSVESSASQARARKHFAVNKSRKFDKSDQPLEIVTTDTGNGKTSTLGPHLRYRYDDYDDSSSEGEEDDDVSVKEITNIGCLLRRLKKARLDRQKIEAVERFVSDGGEGVVLLASFMDQIISFLIFQESRRELLRCLLYSYQQVRSQRGKRKAGKHEDGGKDDHARLHPGHVLVDTTHLTTKEIATRRKALHDAILVAKREIMKLDYYSDRKMSSREYARADLISSDADPSHNIDIEANSKAISVQDRILNEGLEEVEEEWSEDMENEDGEVSSERESSAHYSEDDASTITPRSSASRLDKGKAPEYRIPLSDVNTSPDKTQGMPDNVANRVQQEQNSTVANVQNKVINFVTSS